MDQPARTCDDHGMTGIQDWDRVALAALRDGGPATDRELAERIEEDQFDEPMARAWLRDAESRGLIHGEGPLGAIRYEPTPKGSARLAEIG
jgi:DNA-binding PadR family transcriptional regulator